MSEAETENVKITAGELLKQLREEKELSIQDVSKSIHLEPRIVEALEANNFEILPAATYARGYLRSYAKLLKADANQIIALYNNNAPEAPEIIPEVKHPTQTSSTDKPVKAFSYLIILVLVLLVGAWWQRDIVIEPSGISANGPADDTTDEQVNSSIPELEEQVAEEQIGEIDLQATLDPSIATVELSFEEAQAGDEDAGTPVVETPLDPEVASAIEVENEMIDETEASTPVADVDLIDRRGDGPDEIIIELNADSWVEVFELDGNKLYLNLARAGQTLILNGTEPFSVLLGFSQGAVVTFNGEQINHAPYSRSGIARFQLADGGASTGE